MGEAPGARTKYVDTTDARTWTHGSSRTLAAWRVVWARAQLGAPEPLVRMRSECGVRFGLHARCAVPPGEPATADALPVGLARDIPKVIRIARHVLHRSCAPRLLL